MNHDQEIKSWRDLSNDPNAKVVYQFLQKKLLEARKGRIENTNEFLSKFVRNHSVLDIGVVGHTIDRSHDNKWRYDIINEIATHAVGIDILEEEINQLSARGYNVRFVDATSEHYLGERFERIVIGDVIEHVDNPVLLLRFAARHLEPGGRILCSTPNPFFIDYMIRNLRDGVCIANAEHVSWISPSMALELAYRAEIHLDSYWHIQGKGHTLLRKFIVKTLQLIGKLDHEIFSRSFYFIFKHSHNIQ